MGSHSFFRTYRGGLGAREAFMGLQALSCELGGVEGVRVVDAVPRSLADAQALANTRVDDLSTWTPCEAIRLLHETAAVLGDPVTTTVRVQVTHEEALAYLDQRKEHRVNLRWIYPEIADAKARATFDPDRAGAVHVRSRSGKIIKKTRKVVAPTGKTETRYFALVAPSNPDATLSMPAWEDGLPTQAAARARAEELLDRAQAAGNWLDLEVISMTRRVGGEPLVRGTLSIDVIEYAVQVDHRPVITPAQVGTEADGWLFYGWARH